MDCILPPDIKCFVMFDISGISGVFCGVVLGVVRGNLNGDLRLVVCGVEVELKKQKHGVSFKC